MYVYVPHDSHNKQS